MSRMATTKSCGSTRQNPRGCIRVWQDVYTILARGSTRRNVLHSLMVLFNIIGRSYGVDTFYIIKTVSQSGVLSIHDMGSDYDIIRVDDPVVAPAHRGQYPQKHGVYKVRTGLPGPVNATESLPRTGLPGPTTVCQFNAGNVVVCTSARVDNNGVVRMYVEMFGSKADFWNGEGWVDGGGKKGWVNGSFLERHYGSTPSPLPPSVPRRPVTQTRHQDPCSWFLGPPETRGSPTQASVILFVMALAFLVWSVWTQL